jgi:hypothetical protein
MTHADLMPEDGMPGATREWHDMRRAFDHFNGCGATTATSGGKPRYRRDRLIALQRPRVPTAVPGTGRAAARDLQP